MGRLNYHHLRYFREVARSDTLTEAAARLNLSQSALSLQIKTLEDALGHPLFDRVGRRLELTEAGRIALDHADRIFGAGAELVAALAGQGRAQPLAVGAQSTLSRNFQMRFLAPALEAGVALRLASGAEAGLIAQLRALALDVVLFTAPPKGAEAEGLVAARLAAQPVGLHGAPHKVRGSLAEILAREAVILPTESPIRVGFDALAARLGITPRIAAEVDDMAMVRLLARAGAGLAVAPAIVLADEIASGRLASAPHDLGIEEAFYALTVPRSFPHPALAGLIGAFEAA